MLPEYWTNHPEFCTKDGWRTYRGGSDERYAGSSMTGWRRGWTSFWLLTDIAEREILYRTEKGNEDTIALYCHFGVSCVMLSYLWGISPFQFCGIP